MARLVEWAPGLVSSQVDIAVLDAQFMTLCKAKSALPGIALLRIEQACALNPTTCLFLQHLVCITSRHVITCITIGT
eukprot:1153949-Pelagomonas_calceolata.AAC.1